MKLKKIIAFVSAAAMATVALSGCGEQAKTNDEKVYNIGLCQLVQHEALDAATKGFEDVLTEKLGDRVKFDLQNASGDSATCATIVNQFVSSNADLIFANATPALQAAVTTTHTIPIVATSITDYATGLDIDNWTGVTGMNVTGTSDLAPLADQAAIFKEILPDAKKIGILYCSSEANSKYQATIIADELAKLGYETKEYSFADSNDVAAVTTVACDESDAIYIPTDNTAASNTGIIDSIASAKKIPIVAGEEGICEGCGIATLSISYESLGRITGEMAYEILVNGADPATMEIKFADATTKKFMPERAAALGITIPDTYVAIEAE